MTNAIVRRHQDLRRLRESRQKEGRMYDFHNEMKAIFDDPTTNLSDFHVRPLFEALVDDGHEYIQYAYAPNSAGGYRMQEAGEVNTGLFANTMGQYLYSAVLRSYQMPELIGESLVTTQTTNESGEKIPGVSDLADDVEVVNEGDAYPTANVTENWIQTPETIKRGLIVNVTKETVFFDKTNKILANCAKIGRTIAVNKEKRILDVVCGISTIYSRNGGAPEATYAGENLLASTPLVDWTSIDAADMKFMAITDPDTGEPIVTSGSVIVGPPALRNVAGRILNATMTNSWYNTNAALGTQSPSREMRVGGNSLYSNYTFVTNQYVKNRSGNDTTWFYGNPREAFVYMQNWPLAVETVGATGEMAFDRDIVARFKASERGAVGIMERRYMMKVTA